MVGEILTRTLTLMLFIVLLVYAKPVRSIDDQSKIIIEGKDRQPSKSFFEYSDKSDKTDTAISTTDSPKAPGIEPQSDPKLEKRPGYSNKPQFEHADSTAVDEFSTLELIAIGAGGLVAIIALI